MEMLYQVAVATHIIGLSCLAGATLVDYIVGKEFWREYFDNLVRAMAINQARSIVTVAFLIGVTLFIISGLTMMGITRAPFASQLWYKVKFDLMIVLIIGGLAVRRRQALKVIELLSAERTGLSHKCEPLKLKNGMNLFHFIHCMLFVLLFILSIFQNL
jgi:hypothetical protein